MVVNKTIKKLKFYYRFSQNTKCGHRFSTVVTAFLHIHHFHLKFTPN